MVGRRCRVREDADRRLVDLCVMWDGRVSRAESMEDLYRRDEAEMLEAVVTRDEATFRLGSIATQLARVSKDGKVTYHFSSERAAPVANVVKYLMESIGYSCTKPTTVILDCDPPRQDYLDNKEVMGRLADVISWTTSADWRLARGFIEECMDQCVAEKDYDSCLVKCLGDKMVPEIRQFRNPRPDYRPHPIAERDLEMFGITWHHKRHHQQ
jgi:hypothetical protein